MPSVLAIVSKALFEKMVAKDVQLGTIVTTDRYTSSHKAFDGLGDKDAIFLVTVRPPDEKLWLVGILEAPKRKQDAWVAAANTAPLADVTSAIPKLAFESGTGLKAKKGALGMSLQTPRILTPADVKLLRSLVPKKSGAKVSAREAYNEAVAQVIKPGKAGKLGALRLDNRRKPFAGTLEQLDKGVRAQLADLVKQEEKLPLEKVFARSQEEHEESETPWNALEVMDVIDVATSKPKYQLHLWPYGSGALFEHGKTKLLLNVIQHNIDFSGELAEDDAGDLVRDLEKAYKEGRKRLKIDEMVDFDADGGDQ